MIADDEALCAMLGNMPNCATGTVTETELLDVLGGVFNFWPAWARPIMAAELADQHDKISLNAISAAIADQP